MTTHPKHPDYLTCTLGARAAYETIPCEVCGASIEVTTSEGALVELDPDTGRVHLCGAANMSEEAR